MAEAPVAPEAILDYWFGSTPRLSERTGLWFGKAADTDKTIRSRFFETWQLGHEGRLDAWQDTPQHTLALVVLLDQFPRNMFRDTAMAYASDARARDIASAALSRGWDLALLPVQRMFLYLPFEHSEAIEDQRLSVRLFAAMAGEPEMSGPYEYALRHYCVIQRFGRFPYRNAALARASSADERGFLTTPGSRF